MYLVWLREAYASQDQELVDSSALHSTTTAGQTLKKHLTQPSMCEVRLWRETVLKRAQ